MTENNTKAVPLFVLTSWLRQAKVIDKLSSLFTIGATVLLFIPNNPLVLGLAISVFLVGLAEKYIALRVGFDNELFKQLMRYEASSLSEAIALMDEGLTQLSLIKANQHQHRSLASRQQGALNLFKKQCGLCALQLVLFVVLFITYVGC